MAYKTAGQIVKQAAIDLGVGAWEDPFGSSDALARRLCSYFNTCGRDLVHRHDWGQLKTLWEFTTALGDTGNYALPDDWKSMILQTGWDRTKRMPMAGPLSSQEWAYLRAWQVGVTITAMFRMETNQLMLYPQPPPDGVLVSIEYKSNAWLVPDAQRAAWLANRKNTLGAAGLSEAAASTDICIFDDLLMQQYLKLVWKKEIGMDTTSALEDFKDMFDRTVASASPAPVLSLNGPRLGMAVHLIDGQNLPPTGWGH